MPGLKYVPSNRALRHAWTVAGVVAMLVFAGLTYSVISTALELQQTNARLDQSQAERDRLMRQVKREGVRLSFIDVAPGGLRTITYRCKVKTGSVNYVCRPLKKPTP